MNENSKLLQIYTEAIKKLSSTNDFDIQPAHPFLLSIPDDYDKKIKVMLFG